jgi:hypothetical protein
LINLASVQTGPAGRLAIDPSLFDLGNFNFTPTAYPGFKVVISAMEYFLSLQGSLTAAPIFIDLTQFENRFWALEVVIECVSDYSSATQQTVARYMVYGFKSAGQGTSPGINNAVNVYLSSTATSGLSATPLTVFTATAGGLNVNFQNYNGANASARVYVRQLERFN